MRKTAAGWVMDWRYWYWELDNLDDDDDDDDPLLVLEEEGRFRSMTVSW